MTGPTPDGWAERGVDRADRRLGGGPWHATTLHGTGGAGYGSTMVRLRPDVESDAGPDTDAQSVVASPALVGSHRRSLATLVAAVALATAACGAGDDDAAPLEFRDELGPHVHAPERAMAMTVDAVDLADDDILVRLRVSNHDDEYLDMGVQDTIYGPLLVMRDDQGNLYESYAVEPAGIPGKRIADLSFRLAGPLVEGSTSFTVELATQRGPLTSPTATLPRRRGIRWRLDDPVSEPEPLFAAAPRLPDLVHFWLETDPLPDDR